MRVEARVRARVRPVGARPKRERSRDRARGGKGGQGGGDTGPRPAGNRSEVRSPARTSPEDSGAGTSRSARRRRNRSRSGAGRRPEAAMNGAAPTPRRRGDRELQRTREPKEAVAMAEGMTLEEQGEVGRAFLVGLLGEYGVTATVEAHLLDDETVEIAATGDDLGLLVGPRGSTLNALQDLTRAVVQRQCPSRTDRILVDVAGYREKRFAALKRFSTQIAEEVIASGQEKALEPMSPADRKAVHDAVNDIEGVSTRSEGEDPNRYIVIAPAG